MDSAAFLDTVKRGVEAKLEAFLDEKRVESAAIAPESVELTDQVASLTMRGGKRFRPAVLTAGYLAVQPGGDIENTLDAGASMEMLQTYLLIHDDWMDQDDERRGGPSVHAALRKLRGDAHLGDALAILAGDLAAAYAIELFRTAPYKESRFREALDGFMLIQREVFFGQHLDLIASPDTDRMHDLKTGSYTVRGPLRLGALLGDASEAQMASMMAYANPIGIAFQLRDELLGTFGDARTTGKPVGSDIRKGKRTSLICEAERVLTPSEMKPVHDVLGKLEAPDQAVAAAAEVLISCGAKAKVEQRVSDLHGEATRALETADFDGTHLRALADMMAIRNH